MINLSIRTTVTRPPANSVNKMKALSLVIVLIVSIILSIPVPADLLRGLENYVAILEGKIKVELLSSEETQEVLAIHQRLQDAQPTSGGALYGNSKYEIEVSHNDELFIINGEKFEAKTYCFGFDIGDRVIFIERSPSGACAPAEILHKSNNKICDVWCE